MQNWYKNMFVDATVPFKLSYTLIWTALLNSDYTGFEPEFLTSEVRNLLRELPNKLTVNENPYIRLDMCDANAQNHQFSNLPAF